MAPDSDQHKTDYEQLKTTLELYPSIQITQVEGQPPDSYEIEYHLQGYVRNPDGSISTANLHRIRITLPFGYPHFAPTVKPLTHIFHPDIDPAAIRIADHWQKNPNLSDLVLTIGEMICGTLYDSDEPFNQEAADWYDLHRDTLPLDSLQIADIDDSDDERFESLEQEKALDSLGLDDDDIIAAETEEDNGQVDLLRLQLNQNNIFAARRILSEIPETVPLPDREEIELTIARALKESDRLFRETEQHEDNGRLDEAAQTIEILESTAADAPGLEELRNRVFQSQSLADDFSLEEEEEQEISDSETKTDSAPAKQKTKKQKIKKSIFPMGSSIPVKLILAVSLLVIPLILGGMLYLQEKKILSRGQNEWQQIRTLAGKKQFGKAKAKGEVVLREVTGLKLLSSSGKVLSADIHTLFNSEEFKQGLKGNTLYNGVYIPFSQAKKLKQFDALKDTAEQLVKQGKIRQSLPAYQEAIAYADKNGLTDQAGELTRTVNNLRFEDALATAKKAESEKEWENAANTYRRALELSRTLSDDPKEAQEITKRLTTATFRHELDQSKQTFTGAQWQETITTLEHARQLIDANPTAVSSREKAELNRLLLNSRLYQLLTLAREAYEKRDWTGSIMQYQAALDLLKAEKDGFGPDIEESYAKIEKTMLTMQIAQEQSKVLRAKKEDALEDILKSYNKILELIRTSPFQTDKKLHKLALNIEAQITETQLQLDLQDRTNYLKENYQEIFKKNYPTFADSKLEHPKVRFIKKIGNKMLFTMTCVERSQGSSSRLELNYIYDPDTQQWSLYTGQ